MSDGVTVGTGSAGGSDHGGVDTGVDEEVLLARAYLSRVGEPAHVGLWALVDDVGPVEAARLLRAVKADARLVSSTEARRADADPHADLEAAQRHGIRLVVPESAEWPAFAVAALERAARPLVAAWRRDSLTRSESGHPVPPLALWVQGPAELSTLAVRSVGIVGSRAATQYGSQVTAELAYGLAASDVVIVSGGAHGIDAAAHRAALGAGGTTALVSAGGLDRAYPPGNATLFDRVAGTGLVVSESPPGCAPHRRRFLTRNRLVAAFSTGLVVVEAAARSGAMNSARHARVLGRPLMAVPGPVTSAMSTGCHDLLRADDRPALLVTSVEDVLAVVGGAGEGLAPRAAPQRDGDVRSELDRLDPVARAVFEGVRARRWAGADEVAARSGVAVLDVIRAVPTLDLAGLIEVSDEGYRLAARLRPRRPTVVR